MTEGNMKQLEAALHHQQITSHLTKTQSTEGEIVSGSQQESYHSVYPLFFCPTRLQVCRPLRNQCSSCQPSLVPVSVLFFEPALEKGPYYEEPHVWFISCWILIHVFEMSVVYQQDLRPRLSWTDPTGTSSVALSTV